MRKLSISRPIGKLSLNRRELWKEVAALKAQGTPPNAIPKALRARHRITEAQAEIIPLAYAVKQLQWCQRDLRGVLPNFARQLKKVYGLINIIADGSAQKWERDELPQKIEGLREFCDWLINHYIDGDNGLRSNANDLTLFEGNERGKERTQHE